MSPDASPAKRREFFSNPSGPLNSLRQILDNPFFKDTIFPEIRKEILTTVESSNEVKEYETREMKLFRKYRVRTPLVRNLSSNYRKLQVGNDPAKIHSIFEQPSSFIKELRDRVDQAVKEVTERKNRKEKHAYKLLCLEAAVTKLHLLLTGTIGLCINMYDPDAQREGLRKPSISIGCVLCSAA